uniref:Trophinin associated protein n=2 Tax=Rousettus aegyptiacus TaxID=9407 RepID=A0A7J8JNA4_ROUAE|nr:trophinin associated protein [Rousettus aegyptiacus]
MATFQTKRDPLLRNVSPTPSKIPVRSKRCPPLPTVKACALDQENQDPKRLEQKFSVQRPHVDSAGPRRKAAHQTEKSERLVGSAKLRNPLEELGPSPRGQNVRPGPSPQTEVPGVVEFVADPEALATILSGEGVKSCRLGRQPSLAQRVLVRGSQGGTIRRGQGARVSAYSAPRTPTHRLDPARASCFSRLEGPGPRSRTLRAQRLEALIPPSGPSFHPSARPSLQELRRETGGSNWTSVSQASGLLLETPVQSASSLPEGEHEVVTHSDEGGGRPLSLAQWAPLRETREIIHTRDSRNCNLMPSPGSLLLTSIPRPSPFGLAQRVASPGPSAPEQIAVRLFDQESCVRLQEGPGKPPVTSPHGPHHNTPPNLQELKMQRISILQQLLQQEVEGLAQGKCARLNEASSLDMVELQSLLAEIPRTLNVPEDDSGAFHLPELLQQSGLPKPCLAEECGEPQCSPRAEPEVAQLCPIADPGPPVSCHRREPEIPEPTTQEQPKVSEAFPQVEAGPLQVRPQGQTGLSETSSRAEPGASEASPEPSNPESSPQPCCSLWAPATTSVIFSSQRPLCASPPIRSLQSMRPPTGQTGPSSLAPGTLALRQRLKACLTAIHCFHEARLDDECAFYTSRAPPSVPSRVCTNPVATLLEWQEALCFIPVGSAALRDSPS